MRLFIILSMIFFHISMAEAGLIFYESFDGDLSQLAEGATSDSCCDYSIRISEDETRVGDGALRVEHRLSDPIIHHGNRSEVSFSKAFDLEPRGEYWFGFSTYISENWQFESSGSNWMLVWQIHGYPDFDLGEDWRSPPLGLYIGTTGWKITIRSDDQKISTRQSIESVSKSLPMTRGQWTDWVFHVNWSFHSDGFVNVYQNGNLVYQYDGPSYFNDDTGGYMKMGIYRAETADVFTRILYHDEVRVGDASSNLVEVSPAGPDSIPARPTGLRIVNFYDNRSGFKTFNRVQGIGGASR